MYGSNRLGYIEDDVFLGRKCIGKFCNIIAPTLPLLPSVASKSVSVVFGKKRYEISDWLGNVRVVINDRKTPVNSGNATVGYKAQVVSVSDYYGFGGEITERTYDPVKPFYRFGFNTQEKTFELNRDHYTAKFWEYDARLGRRWNVDPKPLIGMSEYSCFNNNPILLNDPSGDIPPELLVRGGKITSSFGFRIHPISKKPQIHRAMDIAAKVGEPIHVYASGVVKKVGYEEKGWGNYIIVQHENNMYTLYAHLSSSKVTEGQFVKNDEIIGYVGKTGRATGSHLHIEVGQASDLTAFLSLKNREETRMNPYDIGDLEEYIKTKRSGNFKGEGKIFSNDNLKSVKSSVNKDDNIDIEGIKWADEMIDFMKTKNNSGVFNTLMKVMQEYKSNKQKEKNDNK